MTQLIGAMLVRNEAGPDRWLRGALQNAFQWCDRVLVLDDRSEDDTVAVCREEGAIVVERQSHEHAWGHEAPARKELWDLATELATDYQSWLLIQDADMLLSADPRPLLATKHVNTWCWTLRDMWDANRYRVGGYWQGHVTPRPWLVAPWMVADGWVAEWPERGLHCGHLPHNWPMMSGVAPEQYYWTHLSYSTPAHREAKAAQYLAHQDQLNDFEKAHARSILDPLDPRPAA